MDTLLGTSSTGDAIYLPYKERDLSTFIVGGTGSGKSSLIERLARCDIEKRTASIVFDIKGTLSKRLLEYSTTVDDAKVRMVSVSTKNFSYPFGLNIYEVLEKYRQNSSYVDRTVSNILSIFQRFWTGEFGPLIQQGLRATALTLIYGNGAMNDIPLLYERKQFRDRMIDTCPRENVKRYWRTYENLPPREQHIWSDPILNKIDQLLSYQTIERIVSQTHTTIDWKQLTDEGYTLLLRFPQGEIGEDPANLLGTMCLSQIADMIYQRSMTRYRPRLHLYIDEYGRYATRQTSFLLKEGREYNIGTTIATQTLSDLGEDEQVSAAIQVGTKIFYNLNGDPDARILASNLKGIPPEPHKRKRTVPENVEEMTPYIWHEMQWVPPESRESYYTIVAQENQASKDHDLIQEQFDRIEKAYQRLLNSVYGEGYFDVIGWVAHQRRFFEQWNFGLHLEEVQRGNIVPLDGKDSDKAMGHYYIMQWQKRTNGSLALLSSQELKLRFEYIFWQAKEEETRKRREQLYQAMESYYKAHHLKVGIPKEMGTGKFHTVYHEVEDEEPPTIAETRDNTVKILATLPKYYAYVQLVSRYEGIVEMEKPKEFTPGPIPQQQFFGRKWEDVQKEIQARQRIDDEDGQGSTERTKPKPPTQPPEKKKRPFGRMEEES